MAGRRCLVSGRRMTDGRWRQVSSWMQESGGVGSCCCRTDGPGQGACEGARNGGVPWHVGYRNQEPRAPMVASRAGGRGRRGMGAELECRSDLAAIEGKMVLCHAATKQRMLLPLQNSRRARLRRDDAKNPGETAGKRKHERLRQGAWKWQPTYQRAGQWPRSHHPGPLPNNITRR